MPVHDWTRVDAGIFHSFHLSWVVAIKGILNTGVLPEHCYALCEQHAGQLLTDILEAIPPGQREPMDSPKDAYRGLRRSVAIRHVKGYRLIALVEILSPTNKDSAGSIKEFAGKIESALRAGVHVLLVDLFPRGSHDPLGIHSIIWQDLEPSADPCELPTNRPLTLAAYAAGASVEAYLEPIAVSDVLPEMPLCLCPDRYIVVPLESTYHNAYRGMPTFWRDVLEGRSDHP